MPPRKRAFSPGASRTNPGKRSCVESLAEVLEYIAVGADIVGISLMVWGFAKSLLHVLIAEFTRTSGSQFLRRARVIRCELGTYLLLGLEFMILSDIVQSALSRTLLDLAFLGAIVLIRTAIGHFLGQELAELASADP